MPEDLPINPQQHLPEEIQAWQATIDSMDDWHPALQAHTRRIIDERGIPVEMPAIVDAVEAVTLNHAAQEAQAAARQLPAIESGRHSGTSFSPRAETLAKLELHNGEIADEAIALATAMEDGFNRTKLLAKLVPLAAQTGRSEALLAAATDKDGSDYHRNALRIQLAGVLRETDPTAAFNVIRSVTSDYEKSKAYGRLADAAPELAPQIYQDVQVAIRGNEKESKHYTDTLITLAPHIPEAGKQALEILSAPPNDAERKRPDLKPVEQLAELSVTLPEALPVAAKRLESIPRSSRYVDTYEQDERTKAGAAVKEAIGKAIERGDYVEATSALSSFDASRYSDQRDEIIIGCLRDGQPELAIAAASEASDHTFRQTIRQAIPVFLKQGNRDAIMKTVAEIVDPVARLSALVTAACYLPELVEDAKVALQADAQEKHDVFYKAAEDGFNDIDVASVDANSVIELMNVVPQKFPRQYENVKFALAQTDQAVRQALLIQTRQEEDPGIKIHNLLRLAGGESEVINEALATFNAAIAPEFQAADSYRAVFQRGNTVIKSLSAALEADGRHAEAHELARQARSEQALVESLASLTPLGAKEASEDLLTIAQARSARELLTSYTDKLATALSDDQLKEVISTIPVDQSAVRAALLQSLAPRLVTSGETAELFSLVPEDANGSYAAAIKAISHEFAHKEVAGLNEAVGRIANDKECLEVLLQLLPDNPELAPLALSRLRTFEYASWSGDDKLETKLLAELIPLSPDGAAMAAEFAASLDFNTGDSGLGRRVDNADLLAAVFAKHGYGNEAMSIVKRRGYRGPLLFQNIAPDLVATGWGNTALEYARTIREQSDRALCLAAIVPATHSEARTSERRLAEEIFGPGALELATHQASDRSANINLFIGEIAKKPLLIETFLTRASSPAELLHILKVVDQAAGELDNGSHLQIQALQLLTRLASSDIMKGQWSIELQEQALGGPKADSQLFSQLANLQQLTNNLQNLGETNLQALLASGYSAAQLFQHPWLATSEIVKLGADMFPSNKGISVQQEWLADHAFVQLDGFNRRAIGRLLQTRLANNLEYSLHDASQWLQAFAVPENWELYDSVTGDTEHRPLKDGHAETELLATIFHSSLAPEELRRLPGFASAGGEMGELKTQKFESLFADPTHTIVYAALLQVAAQDNTPGTMLNIEDVKQTVKEWSEAGLIDTWVANGKDISDRRDLTETVLKLVDTIAEQPEVMTKIPPQINYLRELSKSRSAYIDSTLTWIRAYQNLPGQKLATAWMNRTDALRDGVEDKPAAIDEWMKSSALREYFSHLVDANGKLGSGITPAVLMQQFPKFVTELPSRYGPESSARALEHLHKVFNAEADLTASQIELDDGYTFKVFAKDDPAGMTIGHDTDCCMTLGGASEDCIYKGYSEPSCGFVGLYDGDNKLVAQSFVWHNEGTIVLDNIEAQRGRNIGRVQAQYKTALEKYVKTLHATKPELGIQAVHIGTGYLVSRLSEGLKQARMVTPRIKLGYSDAHSQLELLRLTPEELENASQTVELRKPVAESTPTQPPTAHPEFVTAFDVTAQASEIARLEAQIYPDSLQTGLTEIESDLRKPNNFSFLIGSRTGNSGMVGYALAYRKEFEDTVYVSDLAILPAEQRNGYGIAAIEHLLRQIADAGEQRIVFEARETTSYQALQSPNVQALLARQGFTISKSERLDSHFENGEAAYNVEITKLATV